MLGRALAVLGDPAGHMVLRAGAAGTAAAAAIGGGFRARALSSGYNEDPEERESMASESAEQLEADRRNAERLAAERGVRSYVCVVEGCQAAAPDSLATVPAVAPCLRPSLNQLTSCCAPLPAHMPRQGLDVLSERAAAEAIVGSSREAAAVSAGLSGG